MKQPQTSPYISPWLSCICTVTETASSQLVNNYHTTPLICDLCTFLPTTSIPFCEPTHMHKLSRKYVRLPLRSPPTPGTLGHKLNKGSITHMSTFTPVMSDIPQSHFTLEAPHIKQQLPDALPNLHNIINSTLFHSPETISSFCGHLQQ